MTFQDESGSFNHIAYFELGPDDAHVGYYPDSMGSEKSFVIANAEWDTWIMQSTYIVENPPGVEQPLQ